MQHGNPETDDSAFVDAFETLTLDPALFDHRGHLRLAWCLLSWLPLPEATRRCADGIRRFAIHHGRSQKFSMTMTCAFMHIVGNRMRRMTAGDDFNRFCERNPDLLRNARAVIGRYYSAKVLDDPAARLTFIEPDLEPLP